MKKLELIFSELMELCNELVKDYGKSFVFIYKNFKVKRCSGLFR